MGKQPEDAVFVLEGGEGIVKCPLAPDALALVPCMNEKLSTEHPFSVNN